MNDISTKFCALALITLLAGCSSSDDGGASSNSPPAYTGNTNAAAITSANSRALATSSTEAVDMSVDNNNARTSSPFGVEIIANGGYEIHVATAELISTLLNNRTVIDLPAGVLLGSAEFAGDPNYCGGQLDIPASAASNPSTFSGTLTFDNFCYNSTGVQVVMTGPVVVNISPSSTTMQFVNVQVQSNGQTNNLNATLNCSSTSCTISSDFTGKDGSVYRMQNITVSGDNSSGFSVSGRFFHPIHGFLDISTTNTINFNCADPTIPGSGSIMLDALSGDTILISFDSCQSYTLTVTIGGASVGTSFNW